jgi:hypothetical protein
MGTEAEPYFSVIESDKNGLVWLVMHRTEFTEYRRTVLFEIIPTSRYTATADYVLRKVLYACGKWELRDPYIIQEMLWCVLSYLEGK